jgi:hypothetical protein
VKPERTKPTIATGSWTGRVHGGSGTSPGKTASKSLSKTERTAKMLLSKQTTASVAQANRASGGSRGKTLEFQLMVTISKFKRGTTARRPAHEQTRSSCLTRRHESGQGESVGAVSGERRLSCHSGLTRSNIHPKILGSNPSL